MGAIIDHVTLDKLIDVIRTNLSDDLLGRGHTGHCYVASETLYHLVKDRFTHLTPCTVKIDGVTHWFLKGDGHIIDVTYDQFDRPVDYSKGRGRGFLTKQPSKRAKELMRRVICHLASLYIQDILTPTKVAT